MTSNISTKLEPAKLAFPNGGGLKAMANKTPASQKLEMEALKKKHEVDIAKLQEKHAKANKPQTSKAKKNG
jgi:hypothetical protein